MRKMREGKKRVLEKLRKKEEKQRRGESSRESDKERREAAQGVGFFWFLLWCGARQVPGVLKNPIPYPALPRTV